MYPTHYYWQMRAMGRRYAQMHQLVLYLNLEPGRPITVVTPMKEDKKRFLNFAKSHGIVFDTARQKKWGNAWQYKIKSYERIGK